jgi:hypothetical protein
MNDAWQERKVKSEKTPRDSTERSRSGALRELDYALVKRIDGIESDAWEKRKTSGFLLVLRRGGSLSYPGDPIHPIIRIT